MELKTTWMIWRTEWTQLKEIGQVLIPVFFGGVNLHHQKLTMKIRSESSILHHPSFYNSWIHHYLQQSLALARHSVPKKAEVISRSMRVRAVCGKYHFLCSCFLTPSHSRNLFFHLRNLPRTCLEPFPETFLPWNPAQNNLALKHVLEANLVTETYRIQSHR